MPRPVRWLLNHGWSTGAVVSSYVLRRSSGLARDFEPSDDALPQREANSGMPERSARPPTRPALPLLNRLRGGGRAPLVGLVGMALACAPPPPRLATLQRFVEPAGRTASRWQPSHNVGVLEGAPPEWRSLSVHGDRRAGIALRVPAMVRFRVAVPPRARLEFAVTARPVDAAPRLSVLPRGERRPLHEETLTGLRAWSERRLDLQRYSGRTLELELSVAGSDAEVLIGAPAVVGEARDGERPNVIIYVVDCLRADHVQAYGYARRTTPHIDRLARDGVLFEEAVSCASWTKPAVGCLLSSRHPPAHGARTIDNSLSDKIWLLPERLRDAGYATLAWVANPVMYGEDWGFGRGFDRYVELAHKWKGGSINAVPADAAEITEGVRSWLQLNRDRRFFLYLHSLDLHFGYEPRPPFDAIFVRPGTATHERELDLYDNEIAYNDREIARLMDLLRELDLYDDTLLVLTADHGEEFGEHGFDRHGHSLFEGALRIPLVLKLPGLERRGQREQALVSLLDVGPTVLDWAGLGAPKEVDGVSLRRLLQAGGPRQRMLFAEQISPRETLYAARTSRWKLIQQLVPEVREWLFDLAADPGEARNLVGTGQAEVADLKASLLSFMGNALEGYHLLLSGTSTKAGVRIAATTQGQIVQALRLVARTGDDLRLDPSRHRVVLRFQGGAPRHLVLKTEPPDAPVTLQVWSGGRRLAPSRIRFEPSGASPETNPFRIRAQQLAPWGVANDSLLSLRPGSVAIWYRPSPDTSRQRVNPELLERMRALGYVQ